VQRLTVQGVRFAIVGLSATCVNSGVFVVLVHLGLSGVFSTILAYAVAFLISYFGHSSWTFESKGKLHRFLAASLLGLAMNTAISYVLVDAMASPAWIAAMLMMSLTPVLTYLVMKLWVFQQVPDQR